MAARQSAAPGKRLNHHTSKIFLVFLSLGFVALACPILIHAGPVYLLRLDGAYAPKLNYSPGDVVTDGTNSYVDIRTLIQSPEKAVSVEPGVAADWETYWEFLPFGGPGPQGVQGAPGPPGPIPFTLAVGASNVSGQSFAFKDTAVVAGWTAPDASGTGENFDTYLTDTGTASFNASTGVFTAPISGYYNFAGVLTFGSNAHIEGGKAVTLYLQTYRGSSLKEAQYRLGAFQNTGSGSFSFITVSGAMVVYLAAGDEAAVALESQSSASQPLSTGNGDSSISITYIAP